MPNAAVLDAPAPARPGNESKAPVVPNPFVRASREVVEGIFHDNSVQFVAGATRQVDNIDVPAFGYLRHILVWVAATGGVGGAANVAKSEDAPWNALANITLTDTNGRPIVGPLNGYDLFLANKWGAYSGALDFTQSPLFSDVATGAGASGNFSWLLRIPVEVSIRDGLGSLPNQNSASTYKVGYTISAPATVYTTLPATTLPTVRVRLHAEFWSPTDAADPTGRPNQTQPPGAGTTQHWTKSNPAIAAGDQRTRLTRMGNMLRTVIFVLRTAAGARTTADFPGLLRFEWDKLTLGVVDSSILRHYMWERSEIALGAFDTGVLVLDFQHDLDGKLGFEMRDQWLPTTQATRLEVIGTWGANASSLQVLTNDVAPVAGGAVMIG